MKTIQDLFKLGMDRDIADIIPVKNNSYCLNIGSGNKVLAVECKQLFNIDYPEYDANTDQIPFADCQFDHVFAFHFLEHITNIEKVIVEIHRVLKIGGVLNVVVPYYTSQMQHQDLGHVNSFCEETWKILFSRKYYSKGKVTCGWEIGANIIIGVVERNLALMTQLIKTGDSNDNCN